MKSLLKTFAAILALAGIVALAAAVVDLYLPFRGYTGSVVLDIPPGTPAPAVAKLLQSKGVLAYRIPFLLRYTFTRARYHLEAGEYLFDRPLRPIDIYWKLVKGEILLHPVVIPEGSDRFDMARIFHRQLGLDQEKFLRATEETAIIRDLDPKAPTLEGYLFPDTYRFARGVSVATVVTTMVARFRRVLEAKFQTALSRPDVNLHDVITLASLVEKETPVPAERPIIAGVFERRLEKGWPLACDPTVIYAARLDHRMIDPPLPPLTRDDLKINSSYNTYTHTGLPPGPIASPGEVSIAAALAPAGGDALYFVSNDHGGHYFARTLAEHLRNVARYRHELAETAEANDRSANKLTISGAAPAKNHRRSHSAIRKPSRSAPGQKPKAVHSRIQPGARSQPHRTTGNPGNRGGGSPAVQPEK